ncbi:uncharacterized protein LY89DRAFT_726764 [Mollisia scopiformis]|uniref:Uncharacterized protein n=1 Tax=Mollisia scopiformis TaxID=149040 RepID=A0A194XUI5_MOLSC|nr:uncharacterized protein LY89DRAFT_726764 [Mollisia scopiformis]KUJ23699.1 hypothetical protein LY89DRAFT_726764 [Mollisia scopiformis]
MNITSKATQATSSHTKALWSRKNVPRPDDMINIIKDVFQSPKELSTAATSAVNMQGNKVAEDAHYVNKKPTCSSARTLRFDGASDDHDIYTKKSSEKPVHQGNNRIRNYIFHSIPNVFTTGLRPTIAMIDIPVSDLWGKLSNYLDPLPFFCYYHPDHGHIDICLLFSSNVERIDIDLCVSPSNPESLNDTSGMAAFFNYYFQLFRKISYKDSED